MKLHGVIGTVVLLAILPARAATFTVTTAADSGAGSLRAAMLNANATAGPDFIRFNIGGGGPRTISLLSPLPILTDPVTIDAATQPGYAGLPIIEMNCTGLAGFVVAGTDHVFRFDTSNSVLRGFVINRHGQGGSIQVGVYSLGPNNLIDRNFIGTDLTGTAGFAQPSLMGIHVGSSNSIVRSNVVAGTRWYGIDVEGDDNILTSNFLGTDRDGLAPLGLQFGIAVSGARNRIGLPGQGNVVSGCTNGIIVWFSSAVSNVLQGNLVGTRSTGAAALANSLDGITVGVNASYTVIGGTNSGEGNVISGNRWGVVLATNVGVYVGAVSHYTTIAGNNIGLNAAGNNFIVNRAGGIWIDGSPSNTVGGVVAAARNLISGNDGPGVRISGPGAQANEVLGNYIGLLADGFNSEFNLHGVVIEDGAQRNSIGKFNQQGNIISGNRGDGVRLQGTGTRLNSVYENYIGLDASGTAAVPNTMNGVKATDEAFNNFIYSDVISGNGLDGLALDGVNVAYNFSELCYIGTDASGRNSIPNGRHGVYMANGARNNAIGGQTSPNTVISGNVASGVYITGAETSNNVVRGALIGLSVTDSISLPNGSNGVAIVDAPHNLVGNTNLAGSMRGNIISGQGNRQISPGNFYYAPGILISGQGSFSNRVEGNFIGTDRFGNRSVSNGVGIIIHDAPRNRIGGTNDGVRNVISGNIVNALVIELPGASNNIVWGNFVGTDADGLDPVPNGYGLLISDAPANQIGGYVAESGNLISGNGTSTVSGGVAVSLVGNNAHHNYILLNQIGIDVNGHALGNTGEAVYLIRGPHNNRIGDVNFGNTIAYNNRDGVLVLGGGVWGTTVSNSIVGNSIFSSGTGGNGLGINLQPVSESSSSIPTPNDLLDGDTGPNNVQNFPVITNVFLSAGNTVIRGFLQSQASRQYYIDYYRSSEADPSGYGEGEVYLGFKTITTDAAGRANFSFTNSGRFPNEWFTATATDAATSDTSEFSLAFQAAAGSFRFTVATRSFNENVGSIAATVERVGGSYGIATVKAFPFDDTAINLQDYNFSGVIMTFNDGELTKTFNVAILEDALDEDNEIFTLRLQEPSAGTTLSSPTVTTNIINDNDPLPSLSIADLTVSEGTGGSVNALFTVNLNTPSGRNVSVNYGTADGTAIAPNDYTSTNGLLTILAGATTGTITVPIVTDNLFEPNEKFGVNLASPVNATLADASATGIILDDDPEPRLSINNIVVTEGNDGTATATFTVSLSNPSYLPVSVNYASANGTALAGADYDSTNGVVNIAPGNVSAPVFVTITADDPSEPDENFFMDLIAPVNASIVVSRGACVITELRFVRIVRVGDDMRLIFTTGNGQRYAIDRTDELPASGWVTPPALSSIDGTGAPLSVLDTGVVSGTPLGTGKFYRVRLLP